MTLIYVVGIGPGRKDQMTQRAVDVLEKCDVIIGYKGYVDLIEADFKERKDLISSPMKSEIERCRTALDNAAAGKTVGLISSGDPGIYGMAGLMLEIAGEDGPEIEIVPGMTAACTAAAILGAPIMNDFAVVSLSDLLTPWDVIERRLEAAAYADFVICLYNPSSRGRPENLKKACRVLLKSKKNSTPAGWVRNAGRDGEKYGITTLDSLADEPMDMFCTVIIGNSSTYAAENRMITPRGYGLKQ